MVESRIDIRGELRLEPEDFLRDGFETFKMGRRVFLTGFLIGDDGQSFAQGIGKGEEWGFCFHEE